MIYKVLALLNDTVSRLRERMASVLPELNNEGPARTDRLAEERVTTVSLASELLQIEQGINLEIEELKKLINSCEL